MFTDPQHIFVATVDNTLPRVDEGDQSAVYQNSDETLKFTISHTEKNRVRRMVRLDFNKIAADPFTSGESNMISGSCYLVIDEPAGARFTNQELLDRVKGLRDWATDPNLTKVLAGES